MESSAGLSREVRFEVDANALAQALDRAARRRRNAYMSLVVPAGVALCACFDLSSAALVGGALAVLYVPATILAAVRAIVLAEADATALGMTASAFVERVPRWPAPVFRDSSPEPFYLQGRAP
jgi:hypothetical protein